MGINPYVVPAQCDDFEQRFLHTFVHMFSPQRRRAVELTSAKYEVVVIPDVNRTSADTEMHPVSDTAPGVWAGQVQRIKGYWTRMRTLATTSRV